MRTAVAAHGRPWRPLGQARNKHAACRGGQSTSISLDSRLLRFHAASSSISSPRGRTHEVERSLARVFFPSNENEKAAAHIQISRPVGCRVRPGCWFVRSPTSVRSRQGSRLRFTLMLHYVIAWQQFLKHD
jgi:hypothetical protein